MLMDAFHKDPFWEELAAAAFLVQGLQGCCPTCYCFDIQDTLDPPARRAAATLVWTPALRRSPRRWPAVTTSGGDGGNRVRHRMYHKLNGFLANHDRILCVGCGGCVSACKWDISLSRCWKFFDRKGRKMPP